MNIKKTPDLFLGFGLYAVIYLHILIKENAKLLTVSENVYKIEQLLLSEFITNNAQIVCSFFSLIERHEGHPEQL